ncbi:hypothetical protein [Sporosarcina sp. FA9]
MNNNLNKKLKLVVDKVYAICYDIRVAVEITATLIRKKLKYDSYK